MPFSITPLDDSLVAALQHKNNNKTKPLGALGQLEALALQIGRIQNTLNPSLDHPQVLIFAGDHGAARDGVSAFPQEVSWQMVENILAGGAAISVFTRLNGLGLKVIDAGVAHEFAPREMLVNAKINPNGTRSYLHEAAMSTDECTAALARGREIAWQVADTGCKVLGFGEMGIGNTASASLLTHFLTGAPLADCVGRGTGLDDAGLTRKQQLLARAVDRAALPPDVAVHRLLAEFGGFEIVMMAGAMLGAAERGLILLIDGLIVSSALLAATRIAPAVRDYCIFCHRSAEPGHRAQLAALQAQPLIDLGLRLGEASGVALAWPLVRAAVAFLNEMASFESAGVSGKA